MTARQAVHARAGSRGFTTGQLTVHTESRELAAVSRALRATGRRICLVPTMGALHAGHRELITHARHAPGATVTVVSIFVNPLQFGAGEDLDRYPRRLPADLELCREEGVELVFAPGRDAMYPPGSDPGADGVRTTVQPGPLGEQLEGAVRPGHFAGVLTVVAKLFNIARPELAYFGEKDYQQLVLIRQLADDLDMGVEVVGVPIVREPDGLAMSSRNAYLPPAQREVATTLFAALTAGAQAGGRGVSAVLDAACELLATEPELEVEYLEVRDPELGAAPAAGPARLLVAARLGTTRLIDNVPVTLGLGE